MTANTTAGRREIHQVPWEFRIHAKEIDGDARSAKEIAADLCEEVMKIYGGHPTVAATDMALDNGNFLLAQYQNDYGLNTGDKEHLWVIVYMLLVDVPVRT